MADKKADNTATENKAAENKAAEDKQAAEERTAGKTTEVEDAHGNMVEVPVGLDGENPVSPNNPPAKASGHVSEGVYSAGSQPFEGTYGDKQDLGQAALGNPGQSDENNVREGEVPLGGPGSAGEPESAKSSSKTSKSESK